jgi:hypothetical protein
MPRSRVLSQCLDIQNLAYEIAMGFKTLEPSDEAIDRHARKCVALAQVSRAWEAAADRARILRGRPLPGSLRPTVAKKPKYVAPPFKGPISALWPDPDEPVLADGCSLDCPTDASAPMDSSSVPDLPKPAPAT